MMHIVLVSRHVSVRIMERRERTTCCRSDLAGAFRLWPNGAPDPLRVSGRATLVHCDCADDLNAALHEWAELGFEPHILRRGGFVFRGPN